MTGRTLLAALLCAAPVAAGAQTHALASGRAEVFAGSELERYLRVLQSSGLARAYPWSLRGLGPSEVDSIAPAEATHPWARRYDLGARAGRGPRIDVVAPAVSLWANSAFPYGGDDGAVWQGRGATVAATAGVAVRWGPFSATLAPVVFRAANRPFTLQDVGLEMPTPFSDGRFPFVSDRPQRFGDGPYSRWDPGQSTVRLDVAGVAIGASTANQVWGPAGTYPLILGANAPGYPHVFVGTSRPRDLGLFRFHARLVYGVLRQSPYAGPTYSPWIGYDVDTTRRFASGVVAIVEPRSIPGLELGLARFFHTPWPAGGLRRSDFYKPVAGFLKIDLPDSWGFNPGSHGDPDDQLASLFARWVFPRSGFEVYVEYGREDNNWDQRDLLSEPDLSAAAVLGARKAWRTRGGALVTLRLEGIDAQISTLARGRGAYAWYTHGWVFAGHTERGQVLGSDAAFGGGSAMSVGLDRYDRHGRLTVGYERRLRASGGGYTLSIGVPVPQARDIMHALSLECLRFVGPFDVLAGLTAVQELNRDFLKDTFNLHATLGVQARM